MTMRERREEVLRVIEDLVALIDEHDDVKDDVYTVLESSTTPAMDWAESLAKQWGMEP